MKRLFLMRHAQAAQGTSSDHERTLTDVGREQAANVGLWMRRQSWSVDAIIASTATRTLETATLVRDSLSPDDKSLEEIQAAPTLYCGPMSAYFELLGEFPEDWDSILVVGHNPAVSELVARAVRRSVPVIPATVADIRVPDWNQLAGAGEATAVYAPGGHDLLEIA